MTSSDIARAVLVAMIAIAAMLATSAQLRVAKQPDGRGFRYVVAWLLCVLVMSGLIWVTDAQVGNIDWRRRLTSVGAIGGIFAATLAAGAWCISHRTWTDRGWLTRAISLFLVHAFVIVVLSWFFI